MIEMVVKVSSVNIQYSSSSDCLNSLFFKGKEIVFNISVSHALSQSNLITTIIIIIKFSTIHSTITPFAVPNNFKTVSTNVLLLWLLLLYFFIRIFACKVIILSHINLINILLLGLIKLPIYEKPI
ncbi:hypothetical protein ACTA71_009315 [Dictyostelium dimigraforme]